MDVKVGAAARSKSLAVSAGVLAAKAAAHLAAKAEEAAKEAAKAAQEAAQAATEEHKKNFEAAKGKFFTLAHLNGLHCSKSHSEPRPVKSQRCAGFCRTNGPELLLSVDMQNECLVSYLSPVVSDKNCLPSLDGDAPGRGVPQYLVLPLLGASVNRLGQDVVKERHVLAVVVPPLERLPEALLKDRRSAMLEGVWLFDFASSDTLQYFLARLQMAGCCVQGFETEYGLGQVLGTGSFAQVFDAWHRTTGEYIAAKVVYKSDDSIDKALIQEVCMLRRVRHPSVLDFVGFFSEPNPLDGSTSLILVTEFVSGGALFERVRKLGPLPERRAAFIARQLLSALESIHQLGIVHRDIKTENVILTDREADKVKLVDFGMATLESDEESMTTRCGSPGYIAPEVLRCERYGCKVDCFSIGVLLYILLVGRGPFRGKDVQEMLVRNMECKVQKSSLAQHTVEAQSCILDLLVKYPRLRPAATDHLQHRWLVMCSGSKEGGSAVHSPCLCCKFDEAESAATQSLEADKEEEHREELLNEDMHYLEAGLPLLRSQTPLFAEMQEAIHSGRRKLWWKAGSQAGMIGMSPRVTSTSVRMTSKSGARTSWRDPEDPMSDRLSERRTSWRDPEDRMSSRLSSERQTRVTSTYFMHDGPEEATECKRFSKGRVSSTDPTPHDAPRVSVRDSEGGLLPCIFVEEVLKEMPQESRWSARRRTTQLVSPDSGNPSRHLRPSAFKGRRASAPAVEASVSLEPSPGGHSVTRRMSDEARQNQEPSATGTSDEQGMQKIHSCLLTDTQPLPILECAAQLPNRQDVANAPAQQPSSIVSIKVQPPTTAPPISSKGNPDSTRHFRKPCERPGRQYSIG